MVKTLAVHPLVTVRIIPTLAELIPTFEEIILALQKDDLHLVPCIGTFLTSTV